MMKKSVDRWEEMIKEIEEKGVFGIVPKEQTVKVIKVSELYAVLNKYSEVSE